MLQFIKKLIKHIYKVEPETLRNTIEELIEDTEEEEPSIESDERVLLENVLNLRDLNAKDVMIPRADIIAAPIDINPNELVNLVVKNNLTAIPIYNDALDHVVGIIHIKDLLTWVHTQKTGDFKQLLRNVVFISPTMRILDILIQMRESGAKMAFVVDEYGGIDGLVTFSNVIGEIIGNIKDDQPLLPPTQIEIQADGVIITDGRVTLEEINECLDDKLELSNDGEDIDTVGGLVVFFAGRVPVRGEVIKHPNGLEFEVLEADPRRISRLCIRRQNF